MSGSNDALPPHLEILVPFEWGVWRWFVLRGAGFPAELINRLKEPSCAARADALISAKDPVQWLFQNAIRSLNGMMDELRRKGEDRYGTSFNKILDGRRRLAEGKVPRSEDFSPEILRMFNQITEAMQECERLNTEWFVSFKVGAGAAGSVLAAELSASGAQVLVIEPGGTDDAPTIMNPSIWFYNVGGPLDYHLPIKHRDIAAHGRLGMESSF